MLRLLFTAIRFLLIGRLRKYTVVETYEEQRAFSYRYYTVCSWIDPQGRRHIRRLRGKLGDPNKSFYR